jgi:hypothetical protein
MGEVVPWPQANSATRLCCRKQNACEHFLLKCLMGFFIAREAETLDIRIMLRDWAGSDRAQSAQRRSGVRSVMQTLCGLKALARNHVVRGGVPQHSSATTSLVKPPGSRCCRRLARRFVIAIFT